MTGAANVLRTELPCGCWRGFVKRKTPAFDEHGHPKLDANGGFMLEESEDVEDGFCEEHSQKLALKQAEIAKFLEAGGSSEDALRMLAGASPFPSLVEHEE